MEPFKGFNLSAIPAAEQSKGTTRP
jgi:hypothetical protein